MSILAELSNIFTELQIPVETGVFTGKAPDAYVVLTPLSDSFEVYADNYPEYEVQEVRISLFSKNNYIQWKNRIAAALLNAEFAITGRRYIAYEHDTGFHHYAIDAAKEYQI
jgi:hypothetical protein